MNRDALWYSLFSTIIHNPLLNQIHGIYQAGIHRIACRVKNYSAPVLQPGIYNHIVKGPY